MDEWDSVLKELADDPSDYQREGGLVVISRQGTEHELTLKHVAGLGMAVARRDNGGAETFVPISTFVQRDLLALPRLARQITKVLDRSTAGRPTLYVESSADAAVGTARTRWEAVSTALGASLTQTEPGATTIVQLMAAAGQGKTVLLERLAQRSALAYQPDEHPVPLILPVDLLGRYVGTIDDAIAGSLNNTYFFPGLSQRDVALCVRKHWLVLALDGFDELVARIGSRDAFLRITELLDQLQRDGAIVLSARETFFELYQITTAIRSYLQPKTGSYVSFSVRLAPWSRSQGIEVFTLLRSKSPAADLDELLSAFGGDEDIVLHPFFLTRLAELWQKGERFLGAGGKNDRLARTEYVIDTFIGRESAEKWVDRDLRPFMPVSAHTAMLGAVAEEMWRSGAFRLTKEELVLACEIGLAETGITKSVIDDVLNRAPTHAAFLARDRGYVFLHDRFLHYYLGARVASLISKRGSDSLKAILASRDLNPETIEWAAWRLKQTGIDLIESVKFISTLAEQSKDLGETLAGNVARICAYVLHDETAAVELRGLVFVGDALPRGKYSTVSFSNCQFWQVDLRSRVLSDCRFLKCEFSGVAADAGTAFSGSIFTDCQFRSFELDGEVPVYSPQDVEKSIRTLGGAVTGGRFPAGASAVAPLSILPDAAKCVERFVRQSERTWDVAIEAMEEEFPALAKMIAAVGRQTRVLKDSRKPTAGPKKTFVRFTVDRSKLAEGRNGTSDDSTINEFWRKISERFPGD